MPGAWPAMQSRASGETWKTGRGSCGKGRPCCGESRQTRQARSSLTKASSEAAEVSIVFRYERLIDRSRRGICQLEFPAAQGREQRGALPHEPTTEEMDCQAHQRRVTRPC